MIVRELLALIGLDVDKESFASADTALGKAKSALEALGRAAVSVGVDVAKSTLAFIDQTGQINDAAASAQVATDAFQELAYAASLSDVNSEKLGVGLKSFNALLTEAQKYGSEASKEFARLGIRTRDASGHVRSADDVLGSIADKMAKLPEGPRRAALALKLLGKAGDDLVPVLQGGAAALAEARQEARDLGLVIDEETIKAGDDLGDSMTKLQAVVKSLGATFGREVLPYLQELASASLAWWKANRQLVASGIKSFVAGVKDSLTRLGSALKWVSDNLRLIGIVFASVLLPVLVANAAALAAQVGLYLLLGATAVATGLAAAAAWLAANWPLVLLGAAVGAVLLVLEDVYQFLTGGVSVTAVLVQKVKAFLSDFMSGGKPDDPWWIKALRLALEYIQLVYRFWGFVAGQIGAGLSSLVNRLEGLITKAKALGKYLGISTTETPTAPYPGAPSAGAAIAAGAQVQVAQGAAVAQAGGITGKPASVQISNTITIPPIPGETPAQQEARMKRVFSEEMQRTYREAQL
jgi:hypothetical protein